MKKSLLFLCVLAFISFTANAKVYDWGKDIKECSNNSKLKCDLNDKPITGKVVVDPKLGFGRQETNYTNGIKDGVQKYYHDNGNLAWELNYKNGVTDGASKMYYENGNLKSDVFYKDGKIEADKGYDENGKLTSESYKENGKIIVKEYYENGNLEIELVWKDIGKPEYVKFYRKDGSLKKEIIFEDVVLESEKIKTSDTIIFRQRFKSGKYSGYSYDKDGNKKKMSEKATKSFLNKEFHWNF